MKLFITIIFITLFTYTAVSKLLQLTKNAAVLSHLPFIGTYADSLAWLIPLVELFIVAMLVFNATQQTGFYLSLCLLLVFTGYLIYMLASSTRLPCTCGGVLETLTWKQHVAFNTACIVLNIVALRLPGYPKKSHHPP